MQLFEINYYRNSYIAPYQSPYVLLILLSATCGYLTGINVEKYSPLGTRFK